MSEVIEETNASTSTSAKTNTSSTTKAVEVRKKYILFVGNLSYDTTEADLKEVFEDTKPSSIRLITDKVTKKPKGFAFVEFTGSKYLEAALAKDKQKFKGRKINVELTAGGGGNKSEVRKERIKTKNEKVREEKKQQQQYKESSIEILAETETSLVNQLEMEVEKTLNVDAIISEALVASQKSAVAGIDLLLGPEKQTRMAGDLEENAKVAMAIVQICFNHRDWSLLNENVSILSKKRAIIKQAIAKVFQKCLQLAAEGGDKESKEALLKAVRAHTEGKVYVEMERAQATRQLAAIREAEGDLKGAFELMAELAVETFGSMDRPQKYDFILEQMRLALATEQFSQAQIISRKINPKTFADFESTHQYLKISYSKAMIRLNLHFGKYLECAKCCQSMLGGEGVDSDAVFIQLITFLLLSTHSKDQQELTNQVLQDKRIKTIPIVGDLVKIFGKKELIRWASVEGIVVNAALFAIDVFGNQNWKFELQKRVIEHNVRIIAELYSQIKLTRMAELLNLPVEETESTLAEMIVDGIIVAKIDRFTGVVVFVKNDLKRVDEHVLLNQWSSQIDSLLSLMVKTNHMISKEEMAQSLKY